jgi:hypothetical protein
MSSEPTSERCANHPDIMIYFDEVEAWLDRAIDDRRALCITVPIGVNVGQASVRALNQQSAASPRRGATPVQNAEPTRQDAAPPRQRRSPSAPPRITTTGADEPPQPNGPQPSAEPAQRGRNPAFFPVARHFRDFRGLTINTSGRDFERAPPGDLFPPVGAEAWAFDPAIGYVKGSVVAVRNRRSVELLISGVTVTGPRKHVFLLRAGAPPEPPSSRNGLARIRAHTEDFERCD